MQPTSAETINTSVRFAGLELSSPIVLASGTWGYGTEGAPFIDYSKIGALVMKGVTLEPRAGNPGRRICEVPSGVLNSVGLENVGIDELIATKLPAVADLPCKIFVNFSGFAMDEYAVMAEKLAPIKRIDALEANLSCPNIKSGGKVWATDPEAVLTITKSIKVVSGTKPLIIKLSPNVTDIRPIAEAAIEGGADGLTIANCVLGLAVDAYARKPVFEKVVAGMSGPAIKPIVQRLVYEVAKEFPEVPILGLGGVAKGSDIAEYLMVGASAVGVGAASLAFPNAAMRIHGEFVNYCNQQHITKAQLLHREIFK